MLLAQSLIAASLFIGRAIGQHEVDTEHLLVVEVPAPDYEMDALTDELVTCRREQDAVMLADYCGMRGPDGAPVMCIPTGGVMCLGYSRVAELLERDYERDWCGP
jgi:hypothetical protein